MRIHTYVAQNFCAVVYIQQPCFAQHNIHEQNKRYYLHIFLLSLHYLFNFWIENLKSYCFVDIFRRVCRMLTDQWDSFTHIKKMFIYLYDHQSLFASSVDEGIFKIGRQIQHRLEGPSIANVASGRYLQAKTHTIPQVLFLVLKSDKIFFVCIMADILHTITHVLCIHFTLHKCTYSLYI